MNSKTLLPFRKKAAFGLLFLGLFLWSKPSEAQILPGNNFNNDTLVVSGLPTLGSALIECSPAVNGGVLSAIIVGDATGTNLYLAYAGSTPSSVTLPISNAASSSKPDVILGDDPNNPGVDYIAVICYQDINGDIIVRDYNITNITGTMTATPGLSQNLGAGNAPKIDGFANNNVQIAGLPAMDEFVVVWNKTTLNDIGVYAGEVANVTNAFYQNSYTNAGINPDVAAVRDVISNQLYACVVCYNSTFPTPGSYTYVYDINVSAPPSTPPVVTPLTSGGNDYPRPRIEGMALYEKTNPKWGVLTFSDFDIVQYFTNMNPASPLIIQVQGSPSYNPSYFIYAAAITAGPGLYIPSNPPGLGGPNIPIGNRQCTLAWAGGNDTYGYCVLSAGIGFSPTGVQNYQITNPASVLQVNKQSPVPMGTVYDYIDEYELAMSTSCNSGNQLLTTWWNSNDHKVYYKLTPDNNYQFRPTGITEESHPVVDFEVYPNPSSGKLRIKTTDFKIEGIRILDATGKEMFRTPYNHSSIDISSLSPGHYFINVQSASGQTATRPFVKK